MKQNLKYPNIHMQQTGRRLKHVIESAGYTEMVYGVLLENISVGGTDCFGLTLQ